MGFAKWLIRECQDRDILRVDVYRQHASFSKGFICADLSCHIRSSRPCFGKFNVMGTDSSLQGRGQNFPVCRVQCAGQMRNSAACMGYPCRPSILRYYVNIQNVHGRLSHKPGHKSIGRLVQNFLGRTHLLEFPLVHDGYPVGQSHRFILVVSYINHGLPELRMQPLYQRPHHLSLFCVQMRKGFVEQEYLRFPDDGPSQRYPLLLSAA